MATDDVARKDEGVWRQMREVEPRHEHRSWQPDVKNFLSTLDARRCPGIRLAHRLQESRV
jgi:hypothetical protein